MNKSLICGVFVLLSLPFMNAGCQNNKPAELPASQRDSGGIEVSESVLRMAKWMNFDYKGLLAKAEKGDVGATEMLLNFHAAVDGIDAINHGVTCLELIPVVGDVKFGLICEGLKPKLKDVLRERLTLAQGRTQKEDLRKPIAEWAPLTWYALRDMSNPETANQKPPNVPFPSNPNEKKPTEKTQ